ncbi:hypothetical protein HXX01_00285 [Candidatus Nomurabacteria bacterium]|nr:hypothetical protein [Candidatus Nomurabacteria bacterium]
MSIEKFKFQDIARSERYFTATLLPHLLMANGFEGVRILFKYLFGDIFVQNGDDYEVVSEVDPVRDGGIYNSMIRKEFNLNGRVAVPDLFVRWGDRILVIEAKFFTQPNNTDLIDQLSQQKKAIELVMNYTSYLPSNIVYCLLLFLKPNDLIPENGDLVFTWYEIQNIFSIWDNPNNSYDIIHTIGVLKRSIKRAEEEIKFSDRITFSRINSFDELLKQIPNLTSTGKIWVGFGEGLDTVSDLNGLIHRSHFKVTDDPKGSKNWVRLDELYSKYLSLKYSQS